VRSLFENDGGDKGRAMSPFPFYFIFGLELFSKGLGPVNKHCQVGQTLSGWSDIVRLIRHCQVGQTLSG